MKSGLIVLACFLTLSGSFVAVAELSEGAGVIKDVPEDVILESYRSSSGTHILLTEKSKTAYPYVVLHLIGSGTATVVLDGESTSVPIVSSSATVTYTFEEGDSHILVVTLGSVSETYSFKISKSISIKEIDPDSDELVTLYESELNNEKIIAGVTAFVSACVGIYAAFRIARWRAANGVETL